MLYSKLHRSISLHLCKDLAKQHRFLQRSRKVPESAHLHGVVVLVAPVPLPGRLGDEGAEVAVAHVGDGGREPVGGVEGGGSFIN